MNLFGGFKAKFTRKSKSKDHFEQVVCTKYKIQSEFLDDAPVLFKHNPRVRQTKPKQPLEASNKPTRQHSKSLNDLRHVDQKSKKNILSTPKPIRKTESTSLADDSSSVSNAKPSSVKSRPPYPLPETSFEIETQHHYEEPVDSPTKIKTELLEEPPPIPKVKPPSLMMNQYEYDDPDKNIFNFSSTDDLPSQSTILRSSANTDINISKTIPNEDMMNPREVIKNNYLYFESPPADKKVFTFTTTTDDYEEITPGEEYKETFPLTDKDLEPSTLILMTQSSMEVTPESPNKTFEFNNGFSNDPDEFNVNVVQYDYQRNYSMSEDEISTDGLNNEELKDCTPMGYTSQAATIFFGLDLEPPTPKPRKVFLNSTNSDEEDC